VAAVFLAGERPSPFFWAMSLLGAALVMAFAIPSGKFVPVAGDLCLLAGVAICGAGYALAGSLSRRMPGWEVISWAVVVSLPVLLPATLLLWPDNALAVPAPSWGGLLYVALISQYFGFWLWNSALAIGGVARIGQVQHLQTFSTLILSALLLGETIGPRTILFAIAVVLVVALGVRARIDAAAKPTAAAMRPVEG
jgi:drug/metabolite transporter (DMT)-like permease